MHFFAQIKPKCHIHTMWVAHRRRSAELDHVLFKINDDGIYESGELTDEQIDRFRSRPEIVKLVAMGISFPTVTDWGKPEDVHLLAAVDKPVDGNIIATDLPIPAPKGRPRLKE